jgi:hypothetical protein
MKTFNEFITESVREKPSEEWLRLNSRLKKAIRTSGEIQNILGKKANMPSSRAKVERIMGSMTAASRAEMESYPTISNPASATKPSEFENLEQSVGFLGTARRLNSGSAHY